MTRGYFIILEGIGGSGKTTQAKWLAEELARCGYPAIYDREPTDSDIGLLVRRDVEMDHKFDDVTLTLLFAADRRDHIRRIDDLLRKGTTVVCDRYILSSLVFQGPSVGRRFVELANKESFLPPDLTILMDVESVVARQRLAQRGIVDRFEGGLQALAVARQEFHNLVHTGQYTGGQSAVVDAGLPVPVVSYQLFEKVKEALLAIPV